MILITMAGNSRRFYRYLKPKYMLPLWGATVFTWSLLSFKKYFNSKFFVFAVREDKDTIPFINNIIAELKIRYFTIVIIKRTAGQAETAYRALTTLKATSNDLLIFNIDTFRLNFNYPAKVVKSCDGYLEVVNGEGEHWSFVLPGNKKTHLVKETTEKVRISNFCSTGLYYFNTADLFKKSYEHSLKLPLTSLQGSERYIAPLYNYLIAQGFKIKYHLINKNSVIFCGIPKEYEELAHMPPPL